MQRENRAPGAVVLGSDFKALGVVRSLGRQGIPTIVVDNLPRSAWFSRYVTRRLRWNGTMDGPELVSFLMEASATYHLSGWVLIPTADDVVELVSRNTATLGSVFALVTQGWDVVRWACDKRLTDQMARETGVDYPRTWYPADESELDTLDITYPLILKPAISIRLQHAIRLKAIPVHNPDELRREYAVAAGLIDRSEIMLQEIIPGGGACQFSVATFCKDGEPLLAMTARRTRQYPIDYGLGSSFVEAIEMPELLDAATRLLRYMRVSGMVEVEFKHDRRDGRYKLLDINVRPWGWHTLAIACGLDFPYVMYRDILGEPPAPATPRYGSHWVRLLTDIPAGMQEVRAGQLSVGAYVRSFAGRTVPSVMDWRDPMPAVGDVAIAVSRALHGSFKGANKGVKA